MREDSERVVTIFFEWIPPRPRCGFEPYVGSVSQRHAVSSPPPAAHDGPRPGQGFSVPSVIPTSGSLFSIPCVSAVVFPVPTSSQCQSEVNKTRHRKSQFGQFWEKNLNFIYPPMTSIYGRSVTVKSCGQLDFTGSFCRPESP
jgi:hypothetical protein